MIIANALSLTLRSVKEIEIVNLWASRFRNFHQHCEKTATHSLKTWSSPDFGFEWFPGSGLITKSILYGVVV